MSFTVIPALDRRFDPPIARHNQEQGLVGVGVGLGVGGRLRIKSSEFFKNRFLAHETGFWRKGGSK